MAKQEHVNKWWEQRLEAGSQLSNLKAARDNGYHIEPVAGELWLKRVSTEALFEDFQKYLQNEGQQVVLNSTVKSGFMLMLYRASGAMRGRTRRGPERGKMSYVAVFNDLDNHREFFEDYVRGTMSAQDTLTDSA